MKYATIKCTNPSRLLFEPSLTLTSSQSPALSAIAAAAFSDESVGFVEQMTTNTVGDICEPIPAMRRRLQWCSCDMGPCSAPSNVADGTWADPDSHGDDMVDFVGIDHFEGYRCGDSASRLMQPCLVGVFNVSSGGDPLQVQCAVIGLDAVDVVHVSQRGPISVEGLSDKDMRANVLPPDWNRGISEPVTANRGVHANAAETADFHVGERRRWAPLFGSKFFWGKLDLHLRNILSGVMPRAVTAAPGLLCAYILSERAC